VFTDTEVGLVYSSFVPIDCDGNVISPSQLTPSIRLILENADSGQVQGTDAWLLMALERGYTNLTSTTSVRLDFALSAPFPDSPVSEDFHTWMRLGAAGAGFQRLRMTTCQYRIWGGESGSSCRSRIGAAFYQLKARTDILGFEEALSIAIARGTLLSRDLPKLREQFRLRLITELRSERADAAIAEVEKFGTPALRRPRRLRDTRPA
jgi:hypothetical protein